MADTKFIKPSSTDTNALRTLVPDNKSIATTSTDTDSLRTLVPNTTTAPSATASTHKEKKAKTSWRDKLSFSSKPEEPGKEKWRDASLSEKERWKEWQKAKDKEQRNGGATGVYTYPYRAKGAGKWGFWIAS